MKLINQIPSELKESKMSSSCPYIHPSAVVYQSKVGEWTEIGEKTMLIESSLGDFSYIASSYANIIYTTIERFCSIASHVRINPGNHPMERVTQHHCTYRKKQYGFADQDDEVFFNWRREHQCFVGSDVWIGHSAILLPGVKIGSGSVIGAGCVVTKNIDPYSVVVGVPGKVIKKRFNEDQIDKLLAIEWWNWNYETIKHRLQELENVDLFLEKYS
ncbi:acetyltransferase [bacterium]|nr:acetyltransferase [bacterium]